LTLTKRIVEMMKGSISVKSEEGKGSRFTCDVRLGMEKSEEQPKDDAPKELDLRGKNVLVVDDVEINRDIIFAMLEDSGAILDGARDGAEAVKMFSEKKYDLVLMDLHMPVMDGFNATKNIRSSAQSWAGTVPVISISAESSGDMHQKSMEAGINDHVMKPVNMETLLKTIAKWLM